MADLEEAKKRHRIALELCPNGHQWRFLLLNLYAISLKSHFAHHKVMADLEEAIEVHNEALALIPLDHPNRFITQ